MRVLWLCNLIPGEVRKATRKNGSSGGLWIDHVLEGMRKQGLTIHILFPGRCRAGRLDEKCSYASFREGKPYVYLPELEKRFGEEIERFRPDVIHIWGTEYGHTLAMVNAAENAGMLSHTVVGIQGLCAVIAGHYTEGVPYKVQRGYTFRDFLRQDNILRQQKKFAKRGELEVKALEKAQHVMGRTRWDRACTGMVNPGISYHFCNETLRVPFYDGHWDYASCRKHRIFASSAEYPVKGFHYLLEAFAEVKKKYPDATLAVTGPSYLTESPLRQTRYRKYLSELTRRYGLEDSVEFLGKCSAEQMKAAYLEANVFALSSTIENSPNSLGEAMLLGLPCVAADVGGVTDLMVHDMEGYIYQPTAPYMLAYYICRVFEMEDQAEVLGWAVREHALVTHDPETNLDTMLKIYETLA